MHTQSNTFYRLTFVFLMFAGLSVSFAHAREEDEDEGRRPPMVTNAKWKSECSACHVAYPPRFLPADSWRAIMAGLDKHFGSNASLDDVSISEITDFLVKNARKKDRREPSGKPLLRITESRWFKSEHREVKASVWKNPKVKSAANCNACHTKADEGDYNEHNVRIPR